MILEVSFSAQKDQELEQRSRDIIGCAVSFLAARGIIANEKRIEVSLALVDEAEISRLNGLYRQKEGPTDVLSFAYENDEYLLDGEIILCLDVIRKNAEEDDINWQVEFSKNLIHGMLHLSGFEHGDKMFGLQEEMLRKCALEMN